MRYWTIRCRADNHVRGASGGLAHFKYLLSGADLNQTVNYKHVLKGYIVTF